MTAVSDPPRTDFDLAALVHEHQADVWRYLRYLGAAAADADDLTQETFLAVARTPFEVRSRAASAAYLRTAARNQLLMLRRKQGRQIETVTLAAAESVWAAHCPEGRGDEFLDLLSACREGLAGRTRAAVDLFYQDNLSRDELAVRLDMTAEGVKTLLRRARATLRDCIERKLAAGNRQPPE
ncbi:MAG: RNA polymerase subunit sigma-70 [Planctomycetaceae bacterium]|nr:RNA polymerase subunit sigma-70 [Planctomycetaceae bacterium]